MNLKNKTAIVTGGSLGIGAAIALKLAEYGANITIIDIKNKKETEPIISKIKKLGQKCIAYQADVSNYNNAANIVNQVVEEFGSIDILVNNAGINKDGVIWKMKEEQWDTVININLKGYFNYINAVAGIFRAQKSGRIINIASINGMRGKFGQANYAASKAGIIGLTKTVAKELGKYSITVNAIAPGLIETDMMRTVSKEVREKAISEIVLGKMGQPEDIANLVAFLSSNLAQHITGEVIKVDGGQYI